MYSVHRKTSIQIQKHLLNRYLMYNKVACNFSDIKDLVLLKDNLALKNSGLIPTDKDQLSSHWIRL